MDWLRVLRPYAGEVFRAMIYSIAWLSAPHEYEPDYNAYWRDLESLEEARADVASYEDWFVEYDIR